MPSHVPEERSFASAAAGSTRDNRNGRGDGRGSGDWARRENRLSNGTAILRRSSTTPFAPSSSQADAALPNPNPDTTGRQQQMQSQPHEQSTDMRYSKDQLLDVFRQMKESGTGNGDISHLFAANWNPGQSSTANGRSGWGKSNDGRDNHGPDACWNSKGDTQPISLEEMTEEDKAAFSGDINSPLKPPPQNLKDPNAQGTNGRKASISHGQGSGGFGLSSPASASRPSTRRQQTSDSISGLQSPGAGRFARDESSPFFSRKFNEHKDASDDHAEEGKNAAPFGGLMRSNTGGIMGNGPASPWGTAPSTSAAMSPMGNFGSFTLGGSSANPPTPVDKRPHFGRGESRLAHLMPRESTEDISTKAAERPWRPRQRTDTDPFADELPTGSAALGGGQDTSPPMNPQQASGMGTPLRGTSGDFGMSEVPGFRDLQRGQSHQTPQHHNEPLSPSDTNPYRSPPDDRHEAGDSGFDSEVLRHSRPGLGGIPEHVPNAFGNLGRGFPNGGFDGSDRSQTSSAGIGPAAGQSKGFPPLNGLSSLNGLGGLGGWPTSGNPLGTPDRENRPGFPSAFGNSIFGNMGADLQSPGLGALGGMFGPSNGSLSGSNTAGRGSKLGSLFPAAMQAQMQGAENDASGDSSDMRQSNAFGAIGRNAFTPSRDTDSPMRIATGRSAFEDMFLQNEGSRAWSNDGAEGMATSAFSQAPSAQVSYQQSLADSDPTAREVPTAQQRMMVMPDRMRWVYLDPQGQTQGPWSGLEMHDWYKASFFTADLSVKKLEDTEFEPLGQLIRRIGNSREPFLVPQIGIPHGPQQPGAAFAPAAAGPGSGAAQPGVVQPPFANSFPSFGTTLTAEQQNNLERRKQEEQFLMARQREFLAQQQVNMRQMQGGLPSALHHQSSVHSLQSQPSFGSMTSPIGMQPPIPGVSGFFEGPSRQAPQGGAPADFFREEEIARLSLRERLFNPSTSVPQQQPNPQQMAVLSQNAEAQRQALRIDDSNDPSGFVARLREFEQLRAQHELEEPAESSQNHSNFSDGTPGQQEEDVYEKLSEAGQEEQSKPVEPEAPSLTQQILTQQKAASAKQSPTVAQPDSPWGKIAPGVPMPFPPPPQSTTPLPAPTAQRGRSNLPDALNVETGSRSETPEIASATPSLAPWAKESAESSKGPSLKEIQETEAKKAAELEEMAAAARRANYQQEMLRLQNQANVPAPGLPTTSTWGNSASPATPTSVPSAWAKPTAVKVQVPSSAASKKTLAEIQREEESRKNKVAAAAAAAQPVAGTPTGGKRYADLAGKSTMTAPAIGGSAWSTVGAGGKVKIPIGPAAPTPQAIRSVSNSTLTPPARARPAPAVRSTTATGQTNVNVAMAEFNKWAAGALTNGLNSGVNITETVNTLALLPPDLIAESVYSVNQLVNGNDFAAEYLRRRKQAEKGIVEPAGTSTGMGSDKGGWNEVAKKGPAKEEPTAGFKVVPNKKKGKK